MITAVRYLPDPGPARLAGPRPRRALRVYYDLSGAEVRRRLEQALTEGRPGVTPDDVRDVSAGVVPESALAAVFGETALASVFVGEEEPWRQAS